MTQSEFYVVSRDFNMFDFSLDSKTDFEDCPRCPACGRELGMLIPKPPLVIDLEILCSIVPDLVIGSGEVLVSRALKSVWDQSDFVGLSGWVEVEIGSILAPNVTRVAIHEASPFYMPRIDIGPHRIDVHRTILTPNTSVTCSSCLSRSGPINQIERVELDFDDSRPSDFFIPYGLFGLKIITARLRACLEQEGLIVPPITPLTAYSLGISRTE
jgi:hypothetical protein